MRLLLRDVRLAFPNLFVATAPKGGGEKAFSASFIYPKNHAQVQQIRDAVMAVAKEKWTDKALAIFKTLEASSKLCFHEGSTKAEYEGYDGNLFIATRSKVRPSVFDQQKTPLTAEDGKPYSGCYVNASIEIWAQDNDFGKRVNAQVRGVQFLRDGDAFAGGGSAAGEDEFPEELGVTDDMTA